MSFNYKINAYYFFIEQRSQPVRIKIDEKKSKNSREYYCPDCDKLFQFSSVEILRHKQIHKKKKE